MSGSAGAGDVGGRWGDALLRLCVIENMVKKRGKKTSSFLNIEYFKCTYIFLLVAIYQCGPLKSWRDRELLIQKSTFRDKIVA